MLWAGAAVDAIGTLRDFVKLAIVTRSAQARPDPRICGEQAFLGGAVVVTLPWRSWKIYPFA